MPPNVLYDEGIGLALTNVYKGYNDKYLINLNKKYGVFECLKKGVQK